MLTQKKIITCLSLIILASLSLKLYLIDFSLPETGDNWIYVLRAIANSQGTYLETPTKTQGWNLFLAPFFSMIDSNAYLDYVNISRVASIILSLITIVPVYFLCRKFFSEKFSLLGATIFAFIPQLSYNSILGFSESLFILVFVVAIHFLITKNLNKMIFISFILLGILFWIRFPGLLIIPPFIIVYFIHYRNYRKSIPYFLICILLLLITISPILSMRNSEYGNPLYFESPDVIFVEGSKSFSQSVSYLEIFSIGFEKTMHVWGVSLLPFLLFLSPLGIILSLRNSNVEKRNIISFCILLFSTILFMIPVYYNMSAGRMLFHLYPILIIFSVYTITNVIENKLLLNLFKNKNIMIFLLMFFITTSSVLVIYGIDDYGYGKTNSLKINEIMQYSEYLINNLDGKLLWSKGVDSDWVWVTLLSDPSTNFKNYKISTDRSFDKFSEMALLHPTNLYVLKDAELIGDSIEDYIINGQSLGLRYISVGQFNDRTYFDELYNNENKFPFLIKIFDSSVNGFQEYKVKTFEIDYEKFNQLLN